MTNSIATGTGGTGVSYSATHEGISNEGVKEEQNRKKNTTLLCHPCHLHLNDFYETSYAARHSEETRVIPGLGGICTRNTRLDFAWPQACMAHDSGTSAGFNREGRSAARSRPCLRKNYGSAESFSRAFSSLHSKEQIS